MKLTYRFYRNSLIKIAVGTALCVPIMWRQMSGQERDYDSGALVFMIVMLSAANIGLVVAMLRARRREKLSSNNLAVGGQSGSTRE